MSRLLLTARTSDTYADAAADVVLPSNLWRARVGVIVLDVVLAGAATSRFPVSGPVRVDGMKWTTASFVHQIRRHCPSQRAGRMTDTAHETGERRMVSTVSIGSWGPERDQCRWAA